MRLLSLTLVLLLWNCAGSDKSTVVPDTRFAAEIHKTPTPAPMPTSTPTPTSTPGFIVAQQAGSSDSFVDFIGINTHFSWLGSAYDTSGAEQALENLGIRHLRDSASPNQPTISHYTNLAVHGIHDDLYWNPPAFALPLSNWNPQPAALAASIGIRNLDAYEGWNEPNYSCSGNGAWVSQTTAAQSALWNYMQQNGLSSLPLLAPPYGLCNTWANLILDAHTMGSALAPYSTYGNIHAGLDTSTPELGGYVSSQSTLGGNPNNEQAIALTEVPNKPVIVSETGYGSTNGSGYRNSVGIVGQERYLLRMLLNFWNLGVKRTYIYELIDDYAAGAPNNSSYFAYYGLLKNGGTYELKPSATAIKNLIATLADPGPTFSAGALNYGLGGSLANVDHVLLEKRNGTFELILWQTVVSIDANANPLTVSPQTVTVTLPSPQVVTAQTFTNYGTLSTVNVATSGNTSSFPVTDTPVIVNIP